MAVSSIVDYASLQNAIADYLIRTDLTTQIQLGISLAETEFNRSIRNRQMEVSYTTPTVQGQEGYVLPSDFLQTRTLAILTNPMLTLDFKSPRQLKQLYPSSSWQGEPRCYAIYGQQLLLRPIPDGVYSLELNYYQKIPPLASAPGNTNWLVQQHPDLYLYGSLVPIFRMLNDDAQVAATAAILQRLLADLEEQESLEMWNGSPLTPNTRALSP